MRLIKNKYDEKIHLLFSYFNSKQLLCNSKSFYTNRPLKEYEEIEIIETISIRLLDKKIDVLEKVKEIAKEKDADAIIITDFDYISFVFSFHRIDAVLVKYKN